MGRIEAAPKIEPNVEVGVVEQDVGEWPMRDFGDSEREYPVEFKESFWEYHA